MVQVGERLHVYAHQGTQIAAEHISQHLKKQIKYVWQMTKRTLRTRSPTIAMESGGADDGDIDDVVGGLKCCMMSLWQSGLARVWRMTGTLSVRSSAAASAYLGSVGLYPAELDKIATRFGNDALQRRHASCESSARFKMKEQYNENDNLDISIILTAQS